MKKYVILREYYSFSEGWEREVEAITHTEEAAKKYCATNLVEWVINGLENDIEEGADIKACKEIIKQVSHLGWDTFKSDKDVLNLLSDNYYDFGCKGDYYTFGYDSSDGGDSWQITYSFHEVEELEED